MLLLGVPAAHFAVHDLRAGTGACSPIKVIETPKPVPSRASASRFAGPRGRGGGCFFLYGRDISQIFSLGACVPVCVCVCVCVYVCRVGGYRPLMPEIPPASPPSVFMWGTVGG